MTIYPFPSSASRRGPRSPAPPVERGRDAVETVLLAGLIAAILTQVGLSLWSWLGR